MNRYIIRKEFRESLYESKGLWMIAAAAVILSGLCFIVVNIKEGSVLAQSDILQYAIKAAMFLSLMVSMVLGASCFASERESNTMESLLLTPVSTHSLTGAKYMGVMLVGLLLYLLSIPYLAAIGAGSGLVLRAVEITLVAGILLEIAFVAVAVSFSILLKSSKAAILTSVLFLIIVCFPGMLQSLLKQSAVGLVLMKIDPVSSCFNLMKTMLVDKTSLFSQFSYIVPLLVFAAAGIILLFWTGNKVALKGEK